MSQLYFSQSPLPAGTTSGRFLPPPVNSGDGTGNPTLVLTVNRDLGLLMPDGTSAANQAAVVRVVQGANTIATDNFIGASSEMLFIPDAVGGAVTIVNDGPADVHCVLVSGWDAR